MKLPDRRYLAWTAGLAVTAALPIFAGFTKLGWECSEILGLAGALACLALCGSPVRPRESTPPALLSLSRHEMLGWIALGAAALHILLAVMTDHTVLEYLKPTSPLYQLAGIAGFVLLLVLVATSLANARRRLWRSHRNFQATHIAFGCLLLALLAVHVVTTGRYTAGYARRLLFIRQSALIVGGIVTTVLALSTLIAGRADVALREPLLPRAQMLPLDFDHAKHTAVNCLVCHHNYVDGRGFDGCIQCHRSDRADLKVGIEARFHSFCLSCHRNPDPSLHGHGPVSGCTVCHQPGATPS